MSEDIVAKAEAICESNGISQQQLCEIAEILPELVAKIKHLKQLISRTASNFLQLQPGIVWEGGIDEAMKAAVEKIKQLREERYAILGVKTTEGLTASEWVLRTGLAERQLVAKDTEICILKTEACAAQKNIERRDGDIAGLMKELTKWQVIAIEERCKTIAFAPSDARKDEYMQYEKQAAKELSIQVEQEASYLSRLESDYLTWVQAYYRDLGEEVAMKRAQAALEKIRHDN